MLRNTTMLLTVVLLLVLVLPAAAAKLSGDVFIDPTDAGPDFAVQGEYVGETLYEGKTGKYGVQVIALGDGKFQSVGYAGGLPGAGWDGGEKQQVEGAYVDGMATFSIKNDHILLEIKDGVMTVTKNGDTKVGELKKIERKSPTIGAKPPSGAVVLFDGTTPDAFKGGRMTEDGLLMEGVTSKQNFGSFTLHIEFRTPFKPKARGQGRGNSGFYAQGRYEVQILDSFGLEGKNNECGGVYSISDPMLNMCLPPLSWQTFDVDFTTAKYEGDKKAANARMTVLHNGVPVHEDLELPNTTTAAPVRESAEPGPIYLQNHGNPIRFRNIWLLEKK